VLQSVLQSAAVCCSVFRTVPSIWADDDSILRHVCPYINMYTHIYIYI